MCRRINAAKQVVQEAVVANLNGDLANVFVKLVGTFPGTAAPQAPITIDQRACIYTQRVVGLQAGQTLQIRNSDSLLHGTRRATARRP